MCIFPHFQLSIYNGWFNVSAKEIDSLEKTLTALENDYKSTSPIFDAIVSLKGEVTTLKEKVTLILYLQLLGFHLGQLTKCVGVE